jgi:hypothetical protein
MYTNGATSIDNSSFRDSMALDADDWTLFTSAAAAIHSALDARNLL